MSQSPLKPQPQEPSVLKVGIAGADITPPLDAGLLMSSAKGLWAPFQAVRKPLQARVLALEGTGTKVAIVSLDLLGLHGRAVGGWGKFKRALVRGIDDLRSEDVVVTCTHTHTSPETLALTSLYRTASFRAWMAAAQGAIADAIASAMKATVPCSVSMSTKELRGYSLQRRIPTEGGIQMSDGLQPIPPEFMDREPIDHRVRSIVFSDHNKTPVATIGHAACHPVHEMCIPHVSPDFPGEFCTALAPEFGFAVYLNGAAGDVNPPTVCGGAEAAIRHGKALATVISEGFGRCVEVKSPTLRFCRKSISLPTRSIGGKSSNANCRAHLAALQIGSVALLFLPGEIFVETGRAIEGRSPFSTTLVTSLCESTIGYVPTARAFAEGGYEIGPGKWSYLQPTAEPLLVDAAVSLLQRLNDGAPPARKERRNPARGGAPSRLAAL